MPRQDRSFRLAMAQLFCVCVRILCSNRDEYLSRPTVDAHFHSFGRESDAPFALSGRDLQAGGSWFGINRAGRIALLSVTLKSLDFKANVNQSGRILPSRAARTHRRGVISYLLFCFRTRQISRNSQKRLRMTRRLCTLDSIYFCSRLPGKRTTSVSHMMDAWLPTLVAAVLSRLDGSGLRKGASVVCLTVSTALMRSPGRR